MPAELFGDDPSPPQAAADERQGLLLDMDPVPADSPGYTVLARKYRPTRLAELIGQETLVRTLGNAIGGGRLAQAYLLTGVRGVGKTTTARIIARALNCVGPDGTGGPTTEPCGVCVHCKAIGEDRHVDVLEMDAASRTGVNDIREILDGVRYRPTTARMKVYIIDEVHMLSNQAFNALLKTLEEPPAHVKFIFATTELRKVPVTVISRCQRFDLRRVDAAVLRGHFGRIAEKEGVTAEPEALALIARAADGSVRDGLSLLDQAIALGDGSVREAAVKEMLGLADREQVFDLLEALLRGQAPPALSILRGMHAAGADPLVVVQDLLELTHGLTRIKIAGAADEPGLPEAERRRGTALAEGLSLPVLDRAWQMLFKGLSDARYAADPLQAVEMALIRLAYAADLPTPEDALRLLESGDGAVPAAPRPGGGRPAPSGGGGATAVATAAIPQQEAVARPAPTALAGPRSFEALVDLFREKREGIIASQLTREVRLVRFEPGHVEINPSPRAARDLPGRVAALLSQWTGRRWVVSVSSAPGQPTLHEASLSAATADPVVKALLASFPEARTSTIRRRAVAAGQEAMEDAAPGGFAPTSEPQPDPSSDEDQDE